MKIVRVDPNLCIGCGTCVAIAENIFRLSPEDGLSRVIIPNGELTNPEDEELAEEARDACPAGAIFIDEKAD